MTFARERASFLATRRPAEKIAIVARDAFADAWDGKRMLPVRVEVGVRLIGDGDIGRCRGEASKIADRYVAERDDGSRDHEAWIAAFNDALMRLGVAMGTCKPDDAAEPFFEMAESTVAEALTSEGVRALWDEIVAHATRVSPLELPIDLRDFARLAAMVGAGALAEAGPRGVGAARLLRAALEDLERLAPVAAAKVRDLSPGIDRGFDADDDVVRVKAKR